MPVIRKPHAWRAHACLAWLRKLRQASDRPVCPSCRASFEARRRNQRYCSADCRWRWNREHARA